MLALVAHCGCGCLCFGISNTSIGAGGSGNGANREKLVELFRRNKWVVSVWFKCWTSRERSPFVLLFRVESSEPGRGFKPLVVGAELFVAAAAAAAPLGEPRAAKSGSNCAEAAKAFGGGSLAAVPAPPNPCGRLPEGSGIKPKRPLGSADEFRAAAPAPLPEAEVELLREEPAPFGGGGAEGLFWHSQVIDSFLLLVVVAVELPGAPGFR